LATQHDDTRQPRQISGRDYLDDPAARQEYWRQRDAERDQVEQARAALLPGYRTISPAEYMDDPALRRLYHDQKTALEALSLPAPAADAENACPDEMGMTQCLRPVGANPRRSRPYTRDRDI
jgi:hypothetical protein